MFTLITALLITFLIYCIIEGTKNRNQWIKFEDITGVEHIDQMTKAEFDTFVHDSLKRKGYTITIPKSSSESGADFILERDIKRIVVHVKRYSIKVDTRAVEEVKHAQMMLGAQEAWVITNHYFTDEAKWLAREKHVRLVDRDGLLNALFRK